MSKHVNIVKFEILKDKSTSKDEWDNIKKIFSIIQKQTTEIYNKTIYLCQEYEGFSSKYKEKYGIKPSPHDIFNYKSNPLQNFCYNQIDKSKIILYSKNISQTVKRAVDKWKEKKYKVLTFQENIPQMRKQDTAFDIVKDAIKINKFEKNFYEVEIAIVNEDYTKKEDSLIKSTRIKFLIEAADNYRKKIMEKIESKEYEIVTSQITLNKRKKKWMFHLGYSFEVKENNELNKNKIMGVDIGWCNPVYIAFSDSPNRYVINGAEIQKFSRGIEKRRIQLLDQGKYCGKGRIGHGRKKRIKPIEKLRMRVENFKNSKNHVISDIVVDQALRYKYGVIQMENLSGIADGEKKATFLGKWPYYDLQQKIKYKAEKYGIEVRFINPMYTSARCSKCGYIHREEDIKIWRPRQDKFMCMNCDYGHKFFVHADYNAAQNIAIDGIEIIIENQVNFQIECELLKIGFKKTKNGYENQFGLEVILKKEKNKDEIEAEEDQKENKKWIIRHKEIKEKKVKYGTLKLIDEVKEAVEKINNIIHEKMFCN
jgi:IS605 OrfB family transposase